jgi:hypothetical protein
MSDCYIYYRVAAEHEPAARSALQAMLAELEASAGIAGKAYCKASEPLLWMEVYTAVADPEALVHLLAGLADHHRLVACLADNQRRHVEHFLPLEWQ